MTTEWGPLARPVHEAPPEASDVPWRDNAYVLFWQPEEELFGTVHVSTSPNSEGRRARATFATAGGTVEIIEPLEPGAFASASIAFGLDGRLTVDHPDLRADLQCRPLLALADYTQDNVIPSMGGEPPRHYQQTVAVVGSCAARGHELTVSARGVRDRTWGYRDESVNISEYVWAFAHFDGYSVTAMRFQAGDDTDRATGFVLTADGSQPLNRLSITRDPAGLCAALELSTDSIDAIHLRSAGRRGGVWVPMGAERRGPAMSVFDEFCAFTDGDGRPGFGLVEHGILRRLY